MFRAIALFALPCAALPLREEALNVSSNSLFMPSILVQDIENIDKAATKPVSVPGFARTGDSVKDLEGAGRLKSLWGMRAKLPILPERINREIRQL
jgi:hypothetical protein